MRSKLVQTRGFLDVRISTTNQSKNKNTSNVVWGSQAKAETQILETKTTVMN